jgi:predicted DCC family thiol-disulfide oxidoreductase YuxK
MTGENQPLLAFDGDCRLCIGSIEWLRRLGLLEQIDTRAAATITGTDGEMIQRHRRAGEIVLLQEDRQHALTGAAAMRWLIQRRWSSPMTRLLDLAPVYCLMVVGYRFIASWRRIWLPPGQAPDPILLEPNWVRWFRVAGSILFIALSLELVKYATMNSWQDTALVDHLINWVASFTIVALLLQCVVLRAVGYRRLLDVMAVQSWAVFVSMLWTAPVLWFHLEVQELPDLGVIVFYVVTTALYMRSYLPWLAIHEHIPFHTRDLLWMALVLAVGVALIESFSGINP